ncbi:MAG: hypothetical protein M3O88_07880 [Actinomycetota bacterium]|nr:hypothetical protein [Actinomycetota bacterium]
MIEDTVDEQLTDLIRRDFQSAGDALAAVMAATAALRVAWARLDTAGSEGRNRVRKWLEDLWRGVSKIATDYRADRFSISLGSEGDINVTFNWETGKA